MVATFTPPMHGISRVGMPNLWGTSISAVPGSSIESPSTRSDHALRKVRVLRLHRAAQLLRYVHAASHYAGRGHGHGRDLPGVRPTPAGLHLPVLSHPVPLPARRKRDAATGLHLRGGGSGTAGRLEGDARQRLRQGHGRAGGRDRQGRGRSALRAALMIGLLRLGFDEGISADEFAAALRRHAGDVAGEDVDQLAGVLQRYLRTVPDALGAALAMSKDPHCGRAVAFATGTILTYVFDEEDLLPEATYGTAGMLDDAYLVHGFVDSLRRMYPFAAAADAYDAPDARTSKVVAAVLPEGVAESLLRTCESTIQVAQGLFPSRQGAGSADAPYEPKLRVADGVAAAATATRPPAR